MEPLFDLAPLQAMIDAMPDAPVAPPPRPGYLSRAGREVANLPVNMLEGLTNTAYGITRLGSPGETERIHIPNFFNMDDAQNFPEQAIDFMLGKGGMVDIVGQSLVPAGAVGKLGAAAGMESGPLLEGLKWAAGFAGPEIQREDATAGDVGMAATLGGVQGGLSFLPRKARLLPTLGLAMLHGGYEAANHDLVTGGVAAAADVVGGLLPGQMRRKFGPAHPSIQPLERDTGMFHGPHEDFMGLPQNSNQYALLKQDLAFQESEGAARAAELAAYQEGARSSLKEGVRISNPSGLPENVPFSDLLASFEATQPERGTAARLALEGNPIIPREGDPNLFATLQDAKVHGELLYPPEVFTGSEPRPDASLLGDISPTNPSSIFPVESFGSGARTPEDFAALKKAQRKPRTPRVPKERKEALPSVEEETIVPNPERTFERPPDVVSAPAPVSTTLKAGDKIVHTDVFGDQQQGTYLGMSSDERAKIRLAGERDVVLTSHGKLLATGERSEAPEFATLQKSKIEKIKSTAVKKAKKARGPKEPDKVSVSEWLDEPMGPEDIPDEIAGQDLDIDSAFGDEPQGKGMQRTATRRSKIEDHVEAAGDTQRGHPEAAMMRTQRGFHEVGTPSIIGEAVEHIGDLAHRGSRSNAILNAREKVNRFLKWLGNDPTRWSFEKEVEEGYKSNAIWRYIHETPELKAQFETLQTGREKGRMMDALEHTAEVQGRISNAKRRTQELLKEYGAAHRQYNQPITELGVLGKEAALDVADQNWNGLRNRLRRMSEWLDKYDTLNDAEQFEMLTRPHQKADGSFAYDREAVGRMGKGMPAPRPTMGVTAKAYPTSLPHTAVTAIDKLVNAIKAATNRRLSTSFVRGDMMGNRVAAAYGSGDILYNADHLIETFDGWHKMDTKQKGRVLAETAATIGHEVGHVALGFIREQHPEVWDKLLKEFHAIGEKGRFDIVGEWKEMTGKPMDIEIGYLAGNPDFVGEGYDLHPSQTKALENRGLHEFFAEMSSAHIFGRLNEVLIPKEMAGIWHTIKTWIAGIAKKLFQTGFERDASPEAKQALENFRGIMAEVHDRFATLQDSEYEQLSRRSAKREMGEEVQFKRETSKIKRQIEAEQRKAQEYEGYQYTDDDYTEEQVYYLHGKGMATNPSTGIHGNRAFIEAELARHLGYGVAGMAIGGIAAPRLSNDQLTMAEGVFAGGVLGFGGPIALKRLFMTMPKAGASFQHMSSKEAFIKLFTMNNLRDLGGDAASGQGSAPAKFIRWMERNTNLHLPAALFNAVVESEGPASYAISIASDAFDKARTFKTDPAMDAAVEKFLRGKSTKADLLTALGPHADAKAFGNFILTGRAAIGVLQDMVSSGLKSGKFKDKIIQSLMDGDYLTTQYRMFHDIDYRPTSIQQESLALEMATSLGHDITVTRQIVEDYFHQIEVERGMYSGSRNDIGQKLDSALFQRKNDRLSAVFRDAMGEYTDPKERIMGTLRHLYTNAISSKFYDHVSTMRDPIGLKMAYTKEELSVELQRIDAVLRRPPTGTTPEQIATLQKQQKELSYYVPLDKNLRYGKIAGQHVNRFVRDQLASFDSPWGLMDGSIMRSMAKFHNLVKIGRTALNPITVVRNYIAAPILMGISRANPFDSVEAIKAIKNMTSGLGREMLEHGIYGVDQVRGEFFRSAEQILMGDYDHHGLEGMFKTGMNKVLEFYRMPDMIARGTTYVSAKKRFAAEFKLPQTDRKVIDAARDWTNRYTVNYANVSPLVKSLRQIPFTNLFISYTAEITRITKNLVEDIFTHPNMRQRVFAAGAVGGLVSIPFLMQKASVDALSPRDKEEWQKTQAQLPDYSRSRFRIVLGKEKEKFRYLDITPLLQIDSLLQMMRSAAGNDWKGFAAINPVFGWENTPLANIMAEQISGKDLRTGRPLDTPARRVQEVAKEFVPPLAPGGYEWQRASEALVQTDTGEWGQTNLRTGRRTTPSELVTSYLTGMRLSTIDTNVVHRNVVSDAKRRIANEASYYRDIAQTDLPVATKQKAQQRYQTAVGNILRDLQTKLNGELP